MDKSLRTRSAIVCELVADVISSFGEVSLRVTGASMMPAVWPGDVVKVCRCNRAELEPGQILLYRRSGRLVAHRIVRAEGDLLITRGDAVPNEDPPVREADVLGRLVRIQRRGCLTSPKRSFRLRVCSSILRRSDFCLRMALRAGRFMRQHGRKELSWSS
jgi:signal peptidase I